MIELMKKNKLKTGLFALLILFNIFIATLALIPANKDVTAPGGLNEVKSVIKADTNTSLSGSFNTIYVYSMERVSLLQAFIASLANYNEVSDSSELFNLPEDERIKAGQVEKNQSIEASLICAYNFAKDDGKDVKLEYGFSGFVVRYYQVNNTIFKIGDLITSFIDSDNSLNSLTENKLEDVDNDTIYNCEKEPNQLYKILTYPYYYITKDDIITFIRDGREVSVTILEDFDYYEYVNYFFIYPKYEINKDSAIPSYSLYTSNTLGPSGGLMQTLSVYSQITGFDYTFGKKIAGTGTIDVFGNVGEIGGVSQKIVTAIHNNADVFLCPVDNWDEALKTYNKTLGHEKMHLIKVNTFADAVEALRSLYEN